MAGIRDKLIHDYFGVDLQVVWQTVQEDLPPLRAQMVHVIADLVAEENDDANGAHNDTAPP